MAIYKGREVQVIGEVSKGATEIDSVHIFTKDNSTETAKVSELRFTEAEKKELQKKQSDKFENVSVISDKDLKDLRDSQDEDKIREKLEKEGTQKDVTIKATNAQVSDSPSIQPVKKH